MKCSFCQTDNDADSRFCTSCGAPLQTVDKLDAVYREMRRLSEAMTTVEERLATLESRQPGQRSAPKPSRAGKVDAVAEPSSTTAAGGPSQQAGARPRHTRSREWEQVLGGNWLARVGVFTLIIGIAFFLKFAFDNNWLGPLARVILGVVVGLGLLGGGYRWHSKYPVFAQAISGGGIAILYLSVFAAFVTFDLIGALPAVLLMFLLSVGSAFIAVRYNSMALAILGILGAFAAPVLLGAEVPAEDRLAAARLGLQLLAYVLIVDAGVLVLSTFRNWRWFTSLALAGSLVFFIEWYSLAGDKLTLLASEGGITLIFLMFVAATTVHHLIRRLPAVGADLALMTVNAIAYLGISYDLMWSDLRGWMGGFSLLLALLYCGITYMSSRRGVQNATLMSFALGIAVVILSIGVPVQFERQVWTTVAWAAELVAVIWLSFAIRMPQLRFYGYGIFVLMAGNLVVFWTGVNIPEHRPVLNERFLVYAVGIAAAYVSANLLLRHRTSDAALAVPASTLMVGANVLTLWLFTFEVWDYFEKRRAMGLLTEGRSIQLLSLTGVWAVYAVVLLIVGIVKRYRSVRLWGLALLTLPVIKVFVYDVFALEQVYRVIAFVGLGILLIVSAYLYQRYGKAIRGFILSD